MEITNTMFSVIWIIWLVLSMVFCYKFIQGSGTSKFIVAVILSLMMTGLTLYIWWLPAIIVVLFGIGKAKQNSNSLILIGCIILAVIIAATGIRFRKAMKEEKDEESQDIDELLDTYVEDDWYTDPDELPDTYVEDDRYTDIDDPKENEMEDTELYDFMDSITRQMSENKEEPEYSLSETYMNEEEGIFFMYSDEWKRAESEETGADGENVVVVLADNEEDISNSNDGLMILKLLENQITMDQLLIDDEEFADLLITSMEDEVSNVETSVTELSGIPARVVSCDMEDMTLRNYYYVVNSDLYQVSMYRKKENQYMESYFDSVMDTYTISAAAYESDAASSEYILENSDSQYLTRSDLEGLSANDCRLARNELYARYGRRFKDEDMQDYFDACSWYQGVIEPDDFQESMLNEIEIANRDLIIEYEKEMGYR